jgi:hypothetical protein
MVPPDTPVPSAPDTPLQTPIASNPRVSTLPGKPRFLLFEPRGRLVVVDTSVLRPPPEAMVYALFEPRGRRGRFTRVAGVSTLTRSSLVVPTRQTPSGSGASSTTV